MNPLKGNLPLLVLHVCFILATCAAVDCSNNEEILLEQQKCFDDQGINLAMPEVPQQYTGEEMRNAWMEALIMLQSKELCQRQHAYQMAIDCDARISQGCLPIELRKMTHDQKSVANIVPAVCDEIKKVNLGCAVGKLSQMFACDNLDSYSGNLNGKSASKNESICEHFESNRICQINTLMECGCNAVRVLDLILRELVQPVTCHPVTEDTVDCDNTEVEYSDNKSNQLVHHFAFSLFFCVLLNFSLNNNLWIVR